MADRCRDDEERSTSAPRRESASAWIGASTEPTDRSAAFGCRGGPPPSHGVVTTVKDVVLTGPAARMGDHAGPDGPGLYGISIIT